jgi:hydrophobic surface binding protein A
MRFLVALTSIIAVARATAGSPQQRFPAVSGAQIVNAVNAISASYANVVADAKQLSAAPQSSRLFFQHSEDAIKAVYETIRLMSQMQSFDAPTALSLSGPLAGLVVQVNQLSSTLKSRKDVIIKASLGPALYKVLSDSYDGKRYPIEILPT